MPVPISRKAYKVVEWHLHNVKALKGQIADEKQSVLQGSACFDLGVPSGHSKHADPTAVKGLLLVDGTKRMQKAMLWLEAIEKTREYFKWSPHEILFSGFYGRKTPVTVFAENAGVDRTKVSRLRDDVVARCAMEAISRGLMKLNDE